MVQIIEINGSKVYAHTDGQNVYADAAIDTQEELDEAVAQLRADGWTVETSEVVFSDGTTGFYNMNASKPPSAS